MHHRLTLLAAVSALSLTAGSAFADEPAADASGTNVQELVIVGTRGEPRSRLETVAPVDVISADAMQRNGISTELAQTLASLTPSLDFPRPSITDGSDHVRPATLRGLAPDQVLVLVNGHRGSIGALVNVNGSIGRGSTAFDLNTVPTVALQSVEVLRDGASAQYGSDAIAGVINLRLREAREGGGAVANIGGYSTQVTTSRGTRSVNDGLTWSVAGWQGLPLGAEGFLTISAEYVNRQPTNRSDFVNVASLPLYTATTVIGRFGDPELESYTGYLNAGLPLNDSWSLYGYVGYQHRDSIAAATARAYNNANNILAVYPLGFLPKIGTDIDDFRALGGVRGEFAGWHADFAVSYGSNTLDYTVLDSINASLGPSSPHTFYAGSLGYNQWLADLDLSRDFEVGLARPLNVAFGLEYRRENFTIGAGEPNSYTLGAFAGAGVSQGFPGFRPANVTDVSRHNWSAYVDFEGHLTEALQFGVAARYEDYSDFGTKGTYKGSLRYDFNDSFAIRGSVSSGFRAPSLQQQFFTYTSTNLVVTGTPPTPQLIEAGTFPVNSAIAIALGARPLEPETSVNYSLGAVVRHGPFELTIDAYQIDMTNRIVLSENLPNGNTPAATATAINALLAPLGISAARFFINGVDTTTRGVDIVGHYRAVTDNIGTWDYTLAANINHTRVTRTPDLPITSLPQPAFLFDRGNRLTFEEGTPEVKVVGTLDWSAGPWGATARATFYDSVLVPNNASQFDYETGDRNLVDLEGRYTFPRDVTMALGVNNLFDVYPQYTPGALNSATGSVGFPSYSPFGFNGRFLYARVSARW